MSTGQVNRLPTDGEGSNVRRSQENADRDARPREMGMTRGTARCP